MLLLKPDCSGERRIRNDWARHSLYIILW